MDTKKIGIFIADARKKKKLTQAEFGEYLNYLLPKKVMKLFKYFLIIRKLFCLEKRLQKYIL